MRDRDELGKYRADASEAFARRVHCDPVCASRGIELSPVPLRLGNLLVLWDDVEDRGAVDGMGRRDRLGGVVKRLVERGAAREPEEERDHEQDAAHGAGPQSNPAPSGHCRAPWGEASRASGGAGPAAWSNSPAFSLAAALSSCPHGLPLACLRPPPQREASRLVPTVLRDDLVDTVSVEIDLLHVGSDVEVCSVLEVAGNARDHQLRNQLLSPHARNHEDRIELLLARGLHCADPQLEILRCLRGHHTEELHLSFGLPATEVLLVGEALLRESEKLLLLGGGGLAEAVVAFREVLRGGGERETGDGEGEPF